MNRRKIVLCVIIILVLVFLFINFIKSLDIEKEDVETGGKILVCIDAGHGGTDVGAVYNNERYEKDDNLNISKEIKRILEEQGIKVMITRDNDTYMSLEQRCSIANKNKANLFVSIHRNSAAVGNGVEVWIDKKETEKDTILAGNILSKLSDTNIKNNRGIRSGTTRSEEENYFVNQNTKMPSCIIELGFITNKEDNTLFDNNYKEYAKAIAYGIIDTLHMNK